MHYVIDQDGARIFVYLVLRRRLENGGLKWLDVSRLLLLLLLLLLHRIPGIEVRS